MGGGGFGPARASLDVPTDRGGNAMPRWEETLDVPAGRSGTQRIGGQGRKRRAQRWTKDGGSAVERLINWMGGCPGNSLLSGTEWEEDLYRAIAAAREGKLPPEPAGKAEETSASLGRRLCERALGAPEGLTVTALTSGADEA